MCLKSLVFVSARLYSLAPKIYLLSTNLSHYLVAELVLQVYAGSAAPSHLDLTTFSFELVHPIET